MGKRNDVYFATLEGQEYLDALKNKVTTYRDYCTSSGRAALWSLSLGAFYGVGQDGKESWSVTPGGEFGELVQQKVNDYSSLVRHEVTLAVKDRPAGIAKAINTNIATLRNARIGTQLVEYYFTDPKKMLEPDYVQCLELAGLSAEAFILQLWEATMGEDMRPDEQGGMLKAGDLSQLVIPTWDATRDVGMPYPDKATWFIFSWRVNKFELAAKYPAYKDEIILDAESTHSIRKPLIVRAGETETDFIENHLLVHMPTDAVPGGKFTLFINDTILQDGDYPFKTKCFHRCSDREMFGTAFGHTANFDLLGLEQVTDMIHSVALNNISTYGAGTIVGPKGGGIAQQDLGKGNRYIEADPNLVDKIRVLELCKTPPEAYAYLQTLDQKKGELSGINSILRGDPQGALKGASGSAMALLQSQAISYNSAFQRAFYRLMSSCGTGIIEFMQQFASDPRIVRIAGKSNAQAVKEFKFTGEQLKDVSTVVFEPINPVLQTASGKLTIADNMLQAGMLTSPKRYIEVLTTGNLNVLLEDQVAVEESIIEENELLGEGKPVMAVITENHQMHIQGHQAVISQPNAKNDPAVVQNVLAHIQEHVDLWQQASMSNPALLAATGQQVLPPMPMPGMPPQGAGPAEPSGPPGSGPSAVMDPNANQGNQPSLPKPPNDPATGEAASVAPGTDVR